MLIGQTAADKARENLVLKLQQVAEKHKAEEEAKQGCEHVMKKFKQTVKTTNPLFHGTAYFIVNVCMLCKIKSYIGYVISR